MVWISSHNAYPIFGFVVTEGKKLSFEKIFFIRWHTEETGNNNNNNNLLQSNSPEIIKQ
jgi:hypothetical protein